MISISAPGKVHLIGEHAVVYGYSAIIAAINKRIKINFKPAKKIKIVIIGNGKKLKKEFGIGECKEISGKTINILIEGNKKGNFSLLFKFLGSDLWLRLEVIIGFLFDYFKIKKGVSLEIKSGINSGMGLGSSAALSVALTKGINQFFSIKLSKRKVNEIARKIEEINHGRPSGGDNTTSTFGGLLLFEKGKFEKLKVPYFLENLIIALTKRQGSSCELIQKVKNLDRKLKEFLIKEIGENVGKLKIAIENEDFEEFKKIINKTQDNLKKLGVSTSKIDEVVRNVRKIGGAAKLSGAGGGGAVLCIHKDKKKLILVLKKLKVPFIEAKIEKEGVK